MFLDFETTTTTQSYSEFIGSMLSDLEAPGAPSGPPGAPPKSEATPKMVHLLPCSIAVEAFQARN